MTVRRKVPDALLERYLADAMDADARAQLELALADSESDRLRVEQLRADSAAFLTQHPPVAFAAALLPQRKRRLWPWLAGLVPIAVAATLILVVSKPEPELTSKGVATLKVFVREGERVRELGMEPVQPGSAIRFQVNATEPGFVTVLGKDGGGNVTVYYPYGKAESAPYDPRAPLLSQAIELDDVPGAEKLYLLYSRRPFDAQWAVDALKNNIALESRIPDGMTVSTKTLQKR